MHPPSPETIWQQRAAKVFLAITAVGASYLLFSHILALLLPFLLAAVLAAVIRPGAALLERKWRVPRRVGATVLLLLLLLLLSLFVTLGCRRLLWELQRLSENLGENSELIGARIEQALEIVSGLTEHIPLLSRLKAKESLSGFWERLDARLATLITDTLSRWSATVPERITALLRGLPGAFFFTLTFLLSAFYLCADGDRIGAVLVSYLPPGLRTRLPSLRARLKQLGWRYLRAYFVLFLLTVVELLVGFSLLRLPYTVLPALLIALVDILPVLGVGTVLIPWGVIELLRGHAGLGTGLLILCGVMLLLRQFFEPRIVGGSLGLHPLATLFAAYVGLELFGLLGMLLGPAAALIVKSILERTQGAAQEKGT